MAPGLLLEAAGELWRAVARPEWLPYHVLTLHYVRCLSPEETCRELNISRASFYRWYRAYVDHGVEGLAPKPPSKRQFWNRIPDAQRERVVEVALARPDLSSRQVAYHITDYEGYFISESSVYRILKGYDLVTSPAYIVMSAADEFKHKTRRVHELWQTDFTYFKITGFAAVVQEGEIAGGKLIDPRRWRCLPPRSNGAPGDRHRRIVERRNERRQPTGLNQDVVVDSDLVTARTGGHCHLFARQIINMLAGA